MLHLHRAERADRLADALGEVLRVPLGDPFAPEVVAVPARGVERWLAQRLSHVLGAEPGQGGICSGIAFPPPGVLLSRALVREDDAWDARHVVWAVLEVVDACTGEAWCSALAAHLGAGEADDDHRRGRRWATAAHLAELFTAYGASRPQMLRDWAQDRDTDGAGGALDPDLRWQAQLWRRLRAHLGEPSPAERLPLDCQALRDDPGRADLPERVSLFGPTRLTTEQLAVLSALAAQREVHLWLPHPSPVLWERVQAAGESGPRRRADRSGALARHPLLASLARDTRELQQQLATVEAQTVDQHHGGGQQTSTLLTRLQADLREDRPPGQPLELTDLVQLGEHDRSVQVHACHGPARQVEVLREVLLRLFADDPSLEPRDVLVLCPDVESYAPLVSAAFGLGDDGRHPGHRLRVRLADRSLRQTNPLLDAVARLLELADGRVTASAVLDLAATPGVRRRFGFDDDDLERLRGWVAGAGVRWGLGAEHRGGWHLDGVPQNTWRTGLDRLLLGVAASEDDLPWLDTALPLDDVDSGDVDLAGRLAELVDRLEDVLGTLTGERPASDWMAALSRGLDLLTAVSDADAWQLAQARRELAAGSADALLRLADVRAVLASRLRGRPTRANFRTGSLTVCTLVPMRSVPHRVVVLLGLDDGVFPRGSAVDGDDVLLRDPCVGERDRRSEDRQLLLDAVLSARDCLVVLHTGADPLTGASRPPAVPVGELLDVLERTARTPDGLPVRERLVVRHPLQPFDSRNFLPGELGGGRPFSFDRRSLAGARRAREQRHPVAPFLTAPLPGRSEPVDLQELVAFLEHPVKAFLRQRLGITLPGEDDEVADALLVELDPLARWDVGERMLTARLQGIDTGSFRQAELRRGTLPPGPLGLRVLTGLEEQVEELAVAGEQVRAGAPRAVDVRVDLGGGRLLSGTVPGVHGATVARTVFSRLGPKHRLRAWAQVLSLQACAPDGWQAATTGRGRGRGVLTKVLTAPEQALGHLQRLVELYDRGMREPLPLDVAAAHAYAQQRAVGGSVEMALEDAHKAWTSEFGGGIADRHHALVWGERPALDGARLGELAEALWAPLLEAES